MKYYDTGYSASKLNQLDEYSLPFENSKYKTLWDCVLGAISDGERILDLGCGPGQFAAMAIAANKLYVTGVDFSPIAVKWARERNPSCNFVVGDIKKFKIYKSRYDVIVILETLEHIEDDLLVLKNIPNHQHVIISVPSYPLVTHVRHFKTMDEAIDRYGKFIRCTGCQAVEISYNRTIWLINGYRRNIIQR